MPYRDRDDLPETLRQRLPPHAQDIYCQAFNHAWVTYGDRPDREAIAHRVAWAAVRRGYRPEGEVWVPRD